MSKLTNGEINKLIEEKTIGVDNIYVENNKKYASIPHDASSRFNFLVKENIDDLMKEIKKGHRRTWLVVHDGKDTICLQDLYFPSYAIIELGKDEDGNRNMKIETAMGGYSYKITERPNDNSEVVFEGPVNALLNQNLIPQMTYVPGTLQGQFYDNKTRKNYTEYMNMSMYGMLRRLKNGGYSCSEAVVLRDSLFKKYEDDTWKAFDELSKAINPQDLYGYNINAKFNNEIDFLPQYNTPNLQNIKYEQARRDMEKGFKIYTDMRKKRIKERLEEVKTRREEAVSGAVVADEIAGKRRSGEIKEPVTPEKGNKLSAEIQAKIKDMKGNTKD